MTSLTLTAIGVLAILAVMLAVLYGSIHHYTVEATPIGKQSDPSDDAAYLDAVRSILDDANLTDREKVSLIENDVVRMFVEAEKKWLGLRP